MVHGQITGSQKYILNTIAFKKLIKERGVSLRFIARWFNVSPSYISALLNNKKTANIDWFFSIITLLHIRLIDLNNYVSIVEENK